MLAMSFNGVYPVQTSVVNARSIGHTPVFKNGSANDIYPRLLWTSHWK